MSYEQSHWNCSNKNLLLVLLQFEWIGIDLLQRDHGSEMLALHVNRLENNGRNITSGHMPALTVVR